MKLKPYLTDPRSPPQRVLLNVTAVANTHVDTMTDVQHYELVRSPSPIDVDALDNSPVPPPDKEPRCSGIRVDFPPGSSAHSSYPFGIHDELGDPWNYSVTNGIMVLRGKGCTMNSADGDSGPCNSCKLLTENGNLQGVLQRIKTGVHENTHLRYHSVGGLVTLVRRKTGEIKALRLKRLNDARKLTGKASAIDDMKRWVMAIGSGKVERIDRLVRVNLARRGGIRNLLDMYNRAAQRVYHPQNYTEEDDLRGLLLWRLGGARVAGIAHHSLNLPSLTTLHRRTVIPRLVISPSIPTRLEVETNVINAFETLHEPLERHRVVHQVFMLDELKTEERPRLDDGSNKIVGVCREHGKKTSLEFNSEEEVKLLLECVDNGEVHLAVEVGRYKPITRFIRFLTTQLGHCRRTWRAEW